MNNTTTFPKVSIITVTFNAEKYLEQTIKSVIEQDYPNIEYIIIDGNSSDKTTDIIKRYESYLSYWLSEPDSGIYDAMNKSINVATGEWIIFMNAGDTFFEKLNITNFINDVKNETELYNGSINFINEDTKEKVFKPPYGLDKIWITVPAWHQASFIRTSLMKKYMYSLEYKIAGDHDFYLKCFINDHKFQFSNQIISNMIDGGLHAQQNKLAYIESMHIIAKYAPNINLVYESDFCKLFYNQFNYIDNIKFSQLYNKIQFICDNYNNIALYGYGTIGKTIEKSLKDIICVIVDQNLENTSYKIPIIKPENLHNYKFEKILVSVLGREEEIIENLLKLNIKRSDIITLDLNDT
jgi:glycosyltransferase involved in cell wall biosynthesis